MSDKKCPCKDCQDRWEKCRIGCGKYKDWREWYDNKKAKENEAKSQYYSAIDYDAKRSHRLWKKQGRPK